MTPNNVVIASFSPGALARRIVFSFSASSSMVTDGSFLKAGRAAVAAKTTQNPNVAPT